MATENLAPQVISRLLGEIRDLVKRPPEGIEYVENDEQSVSEIHAIITGPEETPFFGGRFRMKLVISEDFPNSPPRGFFLTKIFHPNVANNGDICVNTLKRDWNSGVTLKHILQVIRCLLIVPFPESSLNDEAGKLFMESYDEYSRRARIMTEVHSLPVEGKEGVAVGCSSTGAEHGSGDTATDTTVVGNAGVVNTAVEGSCPVGKGSTASAAVADKKKKEKDAKKKSLKRL